MCVPVGGSNSDSCHDLRGVGWGGHVCESQKQYS